MKKAIFFDFDGVLMNSKSLTIDILKQVSDVDEVEFEKIFHTNVFENEKFMKIWSENEKKIGELFSSLTNAEHFFDFAKKLLNDLSKNYNLYIISGAPTENLISHLNLINSTDKFTKILGSDISKSKVERFNMLIESEDLVCENVLFITDSLGDINEANECNLKSIGVTWGVHSSEILQKGNPYKIVDCVDELERIIYEEL